MQNCECRADLSSGEENSSSNTDTPWRLEKTYLTNVLRTRWYIDQLPRPLFQEIMAWKRSQTVQVSRWTSVWVNAGQWTTNGRHSMIDPELLSPRLRRTTWLAILIRRLNWLSMMICAISSLIRIRRWGHTSHVLRRMWFVSYRSSWLPVVGHNLEFDWSASCAWHRRCWLLYH